MSKDRHNPPVKESGVKMKMGVKDRLMIGQILPREGDLISQRIMRDIGQKTELSQVEMKTVKMVPLPDGSLKWDDKGEKQLGQKTIKFTDIEVDFLKDQVKRLDEQKKITRDTFVLCERIHNLKSKEEKEGEDGQGKNKSEQDN